MHIIFEGMDRCGKDTQIDLLISKFPDTIFHKLHYTKLPFNDKNTQLQYSKKLYNEFFTLLQDKQKNYIFNRGHLGENVYAQKYRNYDGSYVFDLEKKYKDSLNNVILITLINSNFEYLLNNEDGNSLSSNIKDLNYEYECFIESHEKSLIKDKFMIDINNFSIEQIHFLICNYINYCD